MESIKKPSNSLKTMKLFNGINFTTNEENMFLEKIGNQPLEIELEISQKIGGIKIWNFNKCEIENDKETDEA